MVVWYARECTCDGNYALVLILESARRQRKEVLVQDHRYRLFSLRDQLRENAIRDPSLTKNWVFQYLDSTIAKSIKQMPRLSIWLILGLVVTYRHDNAMEELGKHLQREYEKPKNRELREIEKNFAIVLNDYLVSRHILLLFMSYVVFILPVNIAKALMRFRKRSLELLIETPETSTLGNFIPEPV